MNHVGIVTGCATCHMNGSPYPAVTITAPRNHNVGKPCENCHHSFTKFN
jgi:hypothetical protein